MVSAARVLLSLLVVAGVACDGSEGGSKGLFVSIRRAAGAFEPGEHRLSVYLDGVARTVVCEVGDDGLVDACGLVGDYEDWYPYPIRGLVAVDAGWDEMFFIVGDPDAICLSTAELPKKVSVIVRRGVEVLGAETWEPEYRGRRTELGCRESFSAHEIVLD